MVRLKFRIAAICLSAGAVGLWSRAMAQTAPVPATSPNSASSLQILTDPHSSQSDRDEAARKLVSSHDESMVPPLVAGLTQPDSGIQLAVASALGDVSWPQPEFVEPLFSLLVNREG